MWDNVAEVMDTFRARRFRQGERAAADLPEPAAAHHPQDGARAGRRRGFRGLFSGLQARSGGDVRRAARHDRRDAQSAPARAAGSVPGRRTAGAHVSHRARREARASCLSGRLDRARAFGVPPGAHAGRALRLHRSRSAADRRDSARRRQGGRADLRPQLRLQHRRPTAGAHRDRPALVARQAAAVARFSAQAARAGGAHDRQPSRRTGIRLAQSPAVSGSAAAASSGQSRFQDGMHARAGGQGSAGGRVLDRLQRVARTLGVEKGKISGGVAQFRAGRNAAETSSSSGSGSPRRPLASAATGCTAHSKACAAAGFSVRREIGTGLAQKPLSSPFVFCAPRPGLKQMPRPELFLELCG